VIDANVVGMHMVFAGIILGIAGSASDVLFAIGIAAITVGFALITF
jgi:hypothetical protein